MHPVATLNGTTATKAPSGWAPPVFVLAAPRSFSTVISTMLGQHPQLYGLPETHLFSAETVGEFLAQCRDAAFKMGDGMLRAVAQICFAAQTERTVARAQGWLARRAHLTTGELFEVLADRVHPLAIVEKSPSLAYSLDALRRVWRMFPDARFVHLVRHPIGQGQSVLKYLEERASRAPIPPTHWLPHLASFPFRFDDEEQTGGPAAVDPQRGWYVLNQNICRFLETIPARAWLRVRGEDVIAAPDTAMPPLARWLGLRTNPHAVEEMKHPERSPYATYGPPSARFGNDMLFLDSPALRPERAIRLRLDDPVPWLAGGRLHPSVVAMARQLGYE